MLKTLEKNAISPGQIDVARLCPFVGKKLKFRGEEFGRPAAQ